MGLIYEPSDDSFLLSKTLKKIVPDFLRKKPNLKILEIGAGSGIQLQALKELGVKNIFGADLNPDAVNYCKKQGFNCVLSDLFSNLPKNENYDLIIFNPPYLPKSEGEDSESEMITTGGKKGSEIINKFLKQSKNYLSPGGKIILLTSSLTKDINFSGYNKKILSEKKLFFEKLFVWELE